MTARTEDRSTPGPGAGGGLEGLAALVSRSERAGRSAPPVETWHPAACGDIDIVIAADGTWYHEGQPILREALTRLFATVLRRDADGDTFLVTPAEKLRITVEDAPFLAVEMDAGDPDAPVLTFRTNMGDVVVADAEHPLRLCSGTRGFVPYLCVRGRLEAKLTRSLAVALADRLQVDGDRAYVLSAGTRFYVADDGSSPQIQGADA